MNFRDWIDDTIDQPQHASFLTEAGKLVREITATARQKHWHACGNEVFQKIPAIADERLSAISLQFPSPAEEWKNATGEAVQHIFKSILALFNPGNLTDGNHRFTHHECNGKGVAYQIMYGLSNLRKRFIGGQGEQPSVGQ